MPLSRNTLLLFSLIMGVCIVISYLYFDIDISLFFDKNANTYEKIGSILSILGESHWYFIVAILGTLFYKYFKKNTLYRDRFLFLLYANIFSGLISIVLKVLFGRSRPRDLENSYGFLFLHHPEYTFIEKINYQVSMLIDDVFKYSSFPSGHSITIMTAFTFISILFPRYIYLWLSIAIIGLSGRILMNSHYLSDVLAGSLIGIMTTLYLYSKLQEKMTLK